MALKLSNNASSLLVSSINTGSTSVVLSSGDEGNFPALGVGDWFPVTIVDGAGNLEIMRCTARSGVTLTVARGQEGTTAKNFNAGARVESRLTLAALLALDLSGFSGKAPIPIGGTGAGTAMEGHDNLSTISTPIASAATTDLSTATGIIVPVTGNAIIVGFGTEQAGATRYVKFTGTPILTHDPAALILPGGVDIAVQAGDVGLVQSLGGGNWHILTFWRASGKPVATGFSLTTIDNSVPRFDGVTGNIQTSGVTIDDNNVVGGLGGLKLVSTDPGAASGPDMELYRKSESPAANDVLGQVPWYANITGGAKTLVAALRAILLDPATGTTALEIWTNLAGTYARRLAIGAGAYMHGALGGDKGIDTFNAGSYFLNGLPLSAKMLAGLKVEVISDNLVQVTALGGLNVTANLAASGVNGLDTGTEAPNTWPNIWLIWSGTAVAALLSLSATAPTMPPGYTQKMRVGAVRNDAFANLWRTVQYGNRVQVVAGTNPTVPPTIYPGGSAYIAYPLAAIVPPTACVIHTATRHSMSDGTNFTVGPNASYNNSTAPAADNNGGITGSFIGLTAPLSVVLETLNLFCGGSGFVGLLGWDDNL